MLLKMRGGLDSIFVTILLGVLIAAFAIWGIGPGLLGGNQSVVATVGSEKIGTQRYYNAVQNQALRLVGQFGGSMSTNDLINTLGLHRQTLQQMIAEAAVASEASRLGLRATDDQVISALNEIDAIQGPDGNFNPNLLRQLLAQNNLTEKDFLDEISRNVVRNGMLTSLVASAPIPRPFAEALQVERGEKRTATLINVGSSDVPAFEDATDEALQTWYDARKRDYQVPELRKFRYVLITPEQYASKTEVSDEEVEIAYERRKDEFFTEETREIQQVSLPSKEAADALVEKVRGGADFVTAASEASAFTADEILLGSLDKESVQSDFGDAAANAVFTLEVGTVSEPVEGLAGYNIFRVVSKTDAAGRTLNDVREELKSDIATEKAINLMYDQLGEVEDMIADDPLLAPLADKYGFTVVTIDGVDANGADRASSQVLTTREQQRILQTMFQADVGEEPEPINLDESNLELGYYFAVLDEVQEPQERELAEIRGRVMNDWRAEETQQRAAKIAEQALARLRTGEKAEDIVQSLGGVSLAARNVTRTAREGSTGVSANIRRLIFELGEGAAELETAADGNGYVVARVDSITPGNPVLERDQVDAIVNELNNTFLQELLAQYQGYLLAKYPAEVNELVLQQLFTAQQN